MNSNGTAPPVEFSIGVNPVQGGVQLTFVTPNMRTQVIVPDSHISAVLDNISQARQNQPRVILAPGAIKP